jgi:hypothetical protein
MARRRVVFTFDDGSLASLRRVTENGGFSEMGAALREAIVRDEALLDEVELGFSELFVRNTQAGKEKRVIVPFLERAKRRVAARGGG